MIPVSGTGFALLLIALILCRFMTS